MTNSKTTKGALLASGISLLLCCAMLLGTTFAWFTDSVTSAGNIIKAGTLDVEMYYAEGTEDPNTATWTDASRGAIFNYDRWEPGYVDVKHIKIANEGNLALKYQVAIVANGKVSELSNVIDVYYVDPAVQVADRTELTANKKIGTLTDVLAGMANTAYGELAAEENHTITLALKMQESAGNEYQNLSIGSDFKVILTATQLEAERDSFDEIYDKDSEYDIIVNTVDELKNALTDEADTIKVSSGTYSFPTSNISEGDVLICDEGTVFEGTSKLNIKGATVVGATFNNPTGTAADQTINGIFKNCTFTGKNGLRWCYAGETVVFENCVFDGSTYGVHFDGGANYVTFKNCTISGFNAMAGVITKTTFDGCTFVSNGKSDYNGINMWGDTEMKNCTFIFDGSCSYEWIDLCGADKTASFANCVVTDGTNTSNVSTLIGGKLTKRETSGKIIVDGRELSY